MDAKQLKNKISSFPQEPGCYLFYNKNQHVIYVGKAKRLKSRVQSYFSLGQKTPKTQILVSHIVECQFILTDSEAEALILENNLIKKHNPKYNIQFRDDKSYPYVYCDMNEPFPRLTYTRRPSRKGKYKIFGPFVTGSNIKNVMQLLIKLFGLRDCTLREMKLRKDPCLLYQMHQCQAPCVDKIDEKQYNVDLLQALAFLEGEEEDTLLSLEKKMYFHADNEEFEKAKLIRDSLFELKRFIKFHQENNVELADAKNIDIIAWNNEGQEVDLVIYMVRNGMLLGNRHFSFINYHDDGLEEILNGVIRYYCNSIENLPTEIMIDLKKQSLIREFRSLLNESMKTVMNWSFNVQHSDSKTNTLMKLAKDQARNEREIRVNNQENFNIASKKLAMLLQQVELPRRMECYDIAIWQGSSPTASQVVFNDGLPVKKDYRSYHLEVRDEGNNDFAMMSEVFSRRLKRENLPDLFVVDGGIGQVNTVKKVFEENCIDVPLVGIAKARIKNKKDGEERTEERLFIFGRRNPYILKNCMPLYRLIVQMRDESHRFSRILHHKSEKKKLIKSWVDNVKGIGPEKKNDIKKRLVKTETEYENMSVSELEEDFNVSRDIAGKLYSYLSSKNRALSN